MNHDRRRERAERGVPCALSDDRVRREERDDGQQPRANDRTIGIGTSQETGERRRPGVDAAIATRDATRRPLFSPRVGWHRPRSAVPSYAVVVYLLLTSHRQPHAMPSSEFLDGIRIVTIAQNVPGPLAAARLRQAGARVIKVEPPAGDPFLALSPAWHEEMHAGISIERLDLKAEAGQARMTALLHDADVFITSQRPSALTRIGLGPEALRSRIPT